MAHTDEDSIQTRTEEWLTHWFGDTHVHAEEPLESGRIPDFTVKTPFGTIVVEVENDVDSATQTQAHFYAAHDPTEYLPVMVLDEAHAGHDDFETVVQSVSLAGGYVVTIDMDMGKHRVYDMTTVHSLFPPDGRPF